jgi:hypothetical protein
MENAWEQALAMSKKALESGGIFLRLVNDGDKVVVAFCGEPCAREVHWTGTAYADCAGHGCDECAGGLRKTLRVGFNVYDVADGCMKIMEGGAKFFTDIVKVRNKYGLDKHAFEIERHGAAGSPKTTYTILPDVLIDQGMRTKMATMAMHDLESAKVRATVAAEIAASAPATPSTLPIGQRRFEPPIDVWPAREIHRLLQRLPEPGVNAFLEQFGVAKVTDLRSCDEEPARRFIESRLGQQLTPF